MQIVPVIDLKGGVVVHARRGRRAEYAPLRSALVDAPEPARVAQALCALCRTTTLYVADLDALAGGPVDETSLAALASIAEPWVDAGATTPEPAAALGRAGAARNVLGTESLGPGGLPDDASSPPRVLSVDLRDGRLISPTPRSRAGTPPQPRRWRERSACARSWSSTWRASGAGRGRRWPR